MSNTKKRRITASGLAGDASAAEGAGGCGRCRRWETPWGPAASLPALHLSLEAGLLHPRAYGRRQALHLLRRSRLQATFDPSALTHPSARAASADGRPPPQARARARVAELLAAGPHLFVLLQSGVCSAFDAAGGAWLCDVNADAGDVVRSMFHNRRRGELLTVSCHAADGFRCLRCRAVPLRPQLPGLEPPLLGAHMPHGSRSSGDGIGRGGSGGIGRGGSGEIGGGYAVFASERVAYPGFFEFDDTNGKALVHNSTTGCYKVFDLSSYSLLHVLPSAGVADVKMSGVLLLVVRERGAGAGGTLPLDVVSAENGQASSSCSPLACRPAQRARSWAGEAGALLARHRLPLLPPAGDLDGPEVLELFGARLLVKQPQQPLRVYDVLTLAPVGEAPQLPGGCALVHLPEQSAFMAVAGDEVSVWDMAARRVATLRDHLLWYPGASDLVYTCAQLRAAISYCKPPPAAPAAAAAPQAVAHPRPAAAAPQTELPEAGAVGAILMADTWTGEPLVMISSAGPERRHAPPRGGGGAAAWAEDSGRGDAAAAAALADVTALFFDEGSMTVYTGNHQGLAHRWGPEARGSDDP